MNSNLKTKFDKLEVTIKAAYLNKGILMIYRRPTEEEKLMYNTIIINDIPKE